MTFLPIVGRELRVAAQRKGTYRLRAYVVIVACGVGLFWALPLMLVQAPGGLGKPLFTAVTSFAFGLCLLAGALLTADSLSEEKREGTLGLLFLTDLKGYDVVLGKFIARSLNAFYGLLALMPIAGLALLLGGLTGGEFWRTTLALTNALFFSLAAGICVSAFGRESQQVIVGTLGLILGLGAGLPLFVVRALAMGFSPAWERVGLDQSLLPIHQGFGTELPVEFGGLLGVADVVACDRMVPAGGGEPCSASSMAGTNNGSRFGGDSPA